MTVTIVRAVETCSACPSQWDAWDSEGNYWYLRYRSAHGSAEQYREGPGWYELDVNATVPAACFFFYADDRDPLDGCMDLAEFCRRTELSLALEAYTPWNEYFADELQRALERGD